MGIEDAADEMSAQDMKTTLIFLIGYIWADKRQVDRTGLHDTLAATAVKLGVDPGYFKTTEST